MANDGSIMATVEKWIADTLAAMEKSQGVKLFKTAEPWNYQIDPAKGGVEAMIKYAPFAFVSFISPQVSREGDFDLRETLIFAVRLGVVSEMDGVARLGDASSYGIGKYYDLTVAALDRKSPASGITDDLKFAGTDLVLETKRAYCLQLYFESNLIRTSG